MRLALNSVLMFGGSGCLKAEEKAVMVGGNGAHDELGFAAWVRLVVDEKVTRPKANWWEYCMLFY